MVAFDFGQLIAEGTPETILQDPTVRSSYLGEVDLEAPAGRLGGRTTAPCISLDAVSHHYGGVRALEDITLSVAKGTVLGVVGTNGAGKSTLGRILHGSLKPSDGIAYVARARSASSRRDVRCSRRCRCARTSRWRRTPAASDGPGCGAGWPS